MSAIGASLDEARDHLRVIRQTMERSTQYSTLSGWSGILIGIVAIVGVYITRSMLGAHTVAVQTVRAAAPQLAALWLAGHALFHLWEVAVGICGTGALSQDFPAVTLPAILTTALALWAWRDEARSSQALSMGATRAAR